MTATSVGGYTDSRGRRVSSYTQNRKAGAAAPRHASQARTRVSLAGAGVFVLYLTFELLAMVLQVGIAALVVVTVSLLGMAGWMQRRRVRSVRRRATRAAVSRVTGRHPGRRSRSPAMYEARARAKVARRQARWQRRDELWTRRKATAVRVAGRIRQGWSQ